jgi:8-oxo-dGTP pyrophosphatase MutT (NUDIX family)
MMSLRPPKYARKHLIGAGVVPFSATPRGLVFYLAREKHIKQWRGSHKWSGFEGGARMGESAIETADREFFEETIGTGRRHSISGELRQKNFALEIITAHANNHQYVTFVKQIDDFHSTLSHFSRLRNSIERLHVLSSQCDTSSLGAEERPLPRVGDADVVDDVLRAHDLRLRMHALALEVQSLCPQCITLFFHSDGLLKSFVLDECFVEKDAIQPWTLKEIGSVLRSGLAEKVFRHSFIPILHVIQREFQ